MEKCEHRFVRPLVTPDDYEQGHVCMLTCAHCGAEALLGPVPRDFGLNGGVTIHIPAHPFEQVEAWRP